MTDLEKEFGLLFEMMMWFKNEFFKWMDNPTCEQCKTPELSVFKGYSTNPANFVLTDRVEVIALMLSFPGDRECSNLFSQLQFCGRCTSVKAVIVD